MGLLDDIQEQQPYRPPACGVYRVRQILSETDREVLEAALADPNVSHQQLTRALLKHMPDFPIQSRTIRPTINRAVMVKHLARLICRPRYVVSQKSRQGSGSVA